MSKQPNVPPMPPMQPRGIRVERIIGPGTLNPGAGKEARRLNTPVKAGEIAGIAYATREHPNSKDPTKTSIVFVGDFVVMSSKENSLPKRLGEVYLPSGVNRSYAAIIAQGSKQDGYRGMPIALEIWAEPDEPGGRETAMGFTYVSYNIAPKSQQDDILELAYASGMIQRPQPALAHDEAPQTGENIDPETGEVS